VIPDLIEYFMAACARAWAAIFLRDSPQRGEGTRARIVDSGLWIVARRSDIFIFFSNDN
jgi:hypothetical protein